MVTEYSAHPNTNPLCLWWRSPLSVCTCVTCVRVRSSPFDDMGQVEGSTGICRLLISIQCNSVQNDWMLGFEISVPEGKLVKRASLRHSAVSIIACVCNYMYSVSIYNKCDYLIHIFFSFLLFLFWFWLNVSRSCWE